MMAKSEIINRANYGNTLATFCGLSSKVCIVKNTPMKCSYITLNDQQLFSLFSDSFIIYLQLKHLYYEIK